MHVSRQDKHVIADILAAGLLLNLKAEHAKDFDFHG